MFEYLEKKLKEKLTSFSEFQELTVRLLDYGVLCRDESQIEQRLYDRYLRIETLVIDYFSVLGITIQHDQQFHFVRLFPPGATIPGIQAANESTINTGLRLRLSQAEIAVVLILRNLYDQALRNGQIDDQGNASSSLEAVNIALKNLLQRSLPENTSERKNMLRRIRQLRLISINLEDEENEDAWLTIRPMITSYVTAEVLQEISQQINHEETVQSDQEISG